MCAESPGARTELGVRGAALGAGTRTGVPVQSGHGVHGFFQSLDRLWIAGTGSGSHGSSSTQSVSGLPGLPKARSGHRVCRVPRWMHGAILGCRDTPNTEQLRTLPGHGWTLRFMERLRVQGRALGCWDPTMYRGAMGDTESLVHGWTLGCTEQLWCDRTPQNTESSHSGCVRQLPVQGQAVRCRDSPVYGMAME